MIKAVENLNATSNNISDNIREYRRLWLCCVDGKSKK